MEEKKRGTLKNSSFHSWNKEGTRFSEWQLRKESVTSTGRSHKISPAQFFRKISIGPGARWSAQPSLVSLVGMVANSSYPVLLNPDTERLILTYNKISGEHCVCELFWPTGLCDGLVNVLMYVAVSKLIFSHLLSLYWPEILQVPALAFWTLLYFSWSYSILITGTQSIGGICCVFRCVFDLDI